MSKPDPDSGDDDRDTGAGSAARSTARPRRPADPSADVLPERTRDEDPEGWGEREYDDDERLRREVPPHHH